MECLTVVVPCFNESEVLQETIDRLANFCKNETRLPVEVLFVDDGSSDRTFEILSSACESYSNFRAIKLSRNFGHQKAVSAGLEYARGAAVIIIDADLQDPPEVMHDMITKWKEGFDVIYGVRRARTGESKFKLGTAKVFYRVLEYFSDIAIPKDTGDFRLVSRRAVDAINRMPETDRFLRGMFSWIGFKTYGLEYDRHERHAGETKYPLTKMIGLALDGILSFSMKPLKLATYLGFICASIAAIGVSYVLYMRLMTNDWVEGWTAIMIAVLFIGGVQLISVGILGLYLGRIYFQVKGRPLFLVDVVKEGKSD